MAQESNEYREQRLQSMAALRDLGYEPYGRRYDHADLRDVRAGFEEGKTVRVAGRLLMIRRMGKMNFCTMNDGIGRFQLIFKRDELSETAFAAFKQLNLGDLKKSIFIRGVRLMLTAYFKTNIIQYFYIKKK